MQTLNAFTFHDTTIRTQVTDEGEPLFCAKDVCVILGYINPWDAIKQHVDSNYDLVKCEVIDTLGRPQQTNFVTESGLYALIFGSKLETAKEFKRWVTSEVLPSIRKTGSYTIEVQPKTDLNTLIEAAKLVLEPAGITGNQLTLSLDRLVKAKTGESVLALTNTQLEAPQQKQLLTPTEIGKPLGLSAIKVNKKLEEIGLQYKTEAGWQPTSLGLSRGAVLLDTGKRHSNGTPVRQLKWPCDIL